MPAITKQRKYKEPLEELKLEHFLFGFLFLGLGTAVAGVAAVIEWAVHRYSKAGT